MSEQAQGSEAAMEQRLRNVDEREHKLDVRESQVTARETRQAEREHGVENVLVQAARRDAVSEARDSAAAKRDMTANMQAWLSGDEDRADAEARQEALDDRLHSKGDRTSSAVDREFLSEVDAPGSPST